MQERAKPYVIAIIIIIVIAAGFGIAYYVNRRALPNKINKQLESMKETKKPLFEHFTEKTKKEKSPEEMLTFNKRKYKRADPKDIEDIFDIDAMMPQETRSDWFDVDHIQKPKKLGGNLIIPKQHIGYDTVGSYKKNPILDIRGDVPIPKTIQPNGFMYSTIEEGSFNRGLCLGGDSN